MVKKNKLNFRNTDQVKYAFSFKKKAFYTLKRPLSKNIY